MAPAVKRRLTPVIYAKQILSAITTIRLQKQIPNFERISRYVQRFSDLTEDEIKKYLNKAVYDGFIDEYTAVGVKGQRTGLEQEGYRILQPDKEEFQDDKHDWYCFECHRPGEVYECSGCFRVFHKLCTQEPTSGAVFTCSICQASRQKNRVKKKMLNLLLRYTMTRLREKTRELYQFGYNANEEEFRRFVYKPMDLDLMEKNVQASRYRSVDEFHADAQLIVHNCALIYGDKGTLTELAILMAIDSKHELDEIDVCPNCYYLSNAKPANWFSEICDPPHEIVYAKQKGFGYWPAKVVQDFDGKYDVRFFGGRHQRAVIPSQFIQPISTDLRTLPVKKSVAFRTSMAELRRYQKKLQKSEKTGTNKRKEQCEKDSWDEFSDGECTEINSAENEQYEHYKNTCEVKQRTSQSTERRPNQSKAERRDSSKIHSRKAEKRKNKTLTEHEAELEDEVANRQVTSTSVEQHAKKRSKKSFQNNYPDETYTVTSTIDKVTNTPEVATVSIAVQTSVQRSDSTSTQTDDAPSVQESLHHLNDRLWEERMVKALKGLTKRMERKFEEEKKLALNELTQQLQEDFGKDKQQAVERTLASMKMEVEKARKAGEDRAREQYMEEMKKLAAKHKDTISQVKKRQWCQFCEDEAMYHCCWNTSYCSVKCQQEHWHKEHKRVCRRKRQ
ncbi:hypothetical protein BsWGS_04982 [Bradybaena similaris]